MNSKIFFCTGAVCDPHDDEKLNEWLAEHPEIYIVNFQYQQSGNAHSIAILYSEGDDYDEFI